jgi:hypothetical protein
MKKLALTAVGVLAASAFVGLTGNPASAAADCNSRPPSNLDHTGLRTAQTQQLVYDGSHTTCGGNGDFIVGDKLDYHCFTVNPNSQQSWTYVYDTTRTWVFGWVNDNNLPDGGSGTYCGF